MRYIAETKHAMHPSSLPAHIDVGIKLYRAGVDHIKYSIVIRD